MPTQYIQQTETFVSPFYSSKTATTPAAELLWGDRVETLGQPAAGRVKVRARGHNGYVNAAHLGDAPLLELYFIDVGQGDGVLICTPDRRHILIDGGYRRSAQPSGKNAADFVDWKFVKDYGKTRISLDAMVCSHNDADHYGGLWDLLNAKEKAELDAEGVDVKAFYTAGVSWLTPDGKKRTLGKKQKVGGKSYLTDLLNDREDLLRMLRPDQSPRFQGDWSNFMEAVAAQGCPVQRVSDRTGWLPGFGEQEPVAIRVLGPVEDRIGDRPALRSLGDDSQNTNGNSLLLRLDYGKARILLTGDLNAASQGLLLERYRGQEGEFACDVVKACHHGSDDCSLAFLQAVNAGATVISSGDAEGHGHPRPAIVSASAITGFKEVRRDRIVTPLIYSTEIARSYRLGRISQVSDTEGTPMPSLDRLRAHCLETASGALRPRHVERSLAWSHLVTGIVYGLVNVRTDGRTILCASLSEVDRAWDVKTFSARF